MSWGWAPLRAVRAQAAPGLSRQRRSRASRARADMYVCDARVPVALPAISQLSQDVGSRVFSMTSVKARPPRCIGHTGTIYRPYGLDLSAIRCNVDGSMDSLRRVAAELSIPERTLRRAASEGLVRGERVSPRRFRVTFWEEAYLRGHWKLLRALRAALRTEPNVRLAVLFGSTATGSDHQRSDVDVLVVLHDPGVGRLADLAERLSRRIGREVQLVRLSDARSSPVLMVDVIERGRVLVDRDDLWSGLREVAARWRRLARRVERSSPAAIDEHDLDDHAA